MSCVAKKSAQKFGLSEHADKSRRSGNPACLKVQSVSQMSFERSVKFQVIFTNLNGQDPELQVPSNIQQYGYKFQRKNINT